MTLGQARLVLRVRMASIPDTQRQRALWMHACICLLSLYSRFLYANLSGRRLEGNPPFGLREEGRVHVRAYYATPISRKRT
mmetsp:Transcript_28298/g.39488  ORF Transcript_28298/g.39488 Transcript_28298/m.39488 type:complete len:81 (+) Transcript_28298:129-371(+)